MNARKATIVAEMSLADIKKLVKVKEKIEALESRRDTLQKELGGVDDELDKLFAEAARLESGQAAGKGGRRKTRKKAAGKKTGKRTAKKKRRAAATTARGKAAGAATRKKAGKKAGKKTGKKVGKKRAKKTGKKATARKKAATRASGQPRLEDVVADLIRSHGGAMAYQDILREILERNLYASRSRNFDNVLRRTLSTSDRVQRVARGIYDVA